jgi:hypothetical protein
MSDLKYITEKIMDSSFELYPYKHLLVENILSQDHLNLIINDDQIKLEKMQNIEALLEQLKKKKYTVINFPGCTTSEQEYLDYLHGKGIKNLYNKDIVEAFGMAFKLDEIVNPEIKRILDFFNSLHFHETVKKKFNISAGTKMSTTIQKYLSGYEISPHPDVRSKALTYLININTSDYLEKLNIHTHLLEFKDKWKYIYQYWKTNESIDRCWVPWQWCDTKKLVSKNNCMVMFSPSNETLHAVKLDYDHLEQQRTQFYGNLWYNDSAKVKKAFYKDIPDHA